MKMRQLAFEGSRFANAHRGLLAWLLVGGILSYGFAAANFSLSIDEEIHLFYNLNPVWAEQGRWGIELTNFILRTTLPLPFFNLTLAVIVLCAAALIWCFVFSLATNEQLASSPWLKLFAVSFVTLPSNAYFLSFNSYNVAIALGSLFAASYALFALLWSTERQGWGAFVLAALFAMVAIAAYQTFLFVCASGALVTFLLHVESLPTREKPTVANMLRRLVKFILPLALGYALYVIVDVVVAPVKSYVDIYFSWGKLDIGLILSSLWRAILAFFHGQGFLGGAMVLPLIAAATVALAIFIWRAVARGEVLQLLLFLGVLLSPFFLWFALGTPMPYRTQQTLPLAYSGVVLLLSLKLGLQDRWRVLAAILTALTIVWNGQANTPNLSLRVSLLQARRGDRQRRRLPALSSWMDGHSRAADGDRHIFAYATAIPIEVRDDWRLLL